MGFSPILAKWPFTDMMDGAVGCRVLLEGRRGEDRVAMTQARVLGICTSYRTFRLGKSAAKDARDVAGKGY